MIFSGGGINLSTELVQGPASALTQAVKKEFTITPVAQGGGAGGSSPGWIGVLTKGYLGQGVQVVAVAPGGPAAEGGLRAGDIIIQVNSISLHDGDFDGLIEERKPGTSVRIGYMRTYWAFETTLTVGRVPT
jgi:C-terminal processing protease CtpA/Prc